MHRMAFLLFLLLPLQGYGDSAEPVERLHSALLEAMQLDDHPAREAHLRPVIGEAFDGRRIAGISLGRTWRSLDDAQRDDFVALLMDLVVATYADRFDRFNNQSFVTDAVQTVQANVVVQTRLVRVDDEDVRLDYVLRQGRIFNVIADGVSDLSLRRADYNSILKQEGYDSLVQHLRDKTAAARNG